MKQYSDSYEITGEKMPESRVFNVIFYVALVLLCLWFYLWFQQ